MGGKQPQGHTEHPICLIYCFAHYLGPKAMFGLPQCSDHPGEGDSWLFEPISCIDVDLGPGSAVCHLLRIAS
eukprot:1138310-Pelagomonas_calceolata.AAC.4